VQKRTAVQPLPLAVLLLCTAVLVAYGIHVRRRAPETFERLEGAAGSPLLPRGAVRAFYWALQAPGRALARLRVAPDAITFLALACSLASLPLVACGRLAEGGLCVALGGALDVLDGLVARLTGRASPAGAVLDSVTDRLADSAPFAGLAVVYRGSAAALLVPIAALVASSLVSYARARADLHGLRLPGGPMRRHERIVYLVTSLLLGPLVPAASLAPRVPYPATLAGVALIAAGSFLGAFLLVLRTRAALVLRTHTAVQEIVRPQCATPALTAENSRTLPPAC
jgi:CDP-diacylglycerol--glycerol-3-phosphate 3-phosphatidyltransferase